MDFVIQQPVESDIKVLLELKDQVRLQTYKEFIPDLHWEDIKYSESYDTRAQKIISQFQEKKVFIFCAKDNSQNILGYIKIIHRGSIVEIQDLFIIPTAQGMGIGSQLMIKAWDLFKDQDSVWQLKVNVLENNTKAIEFYKKHGFAPDMGRIFYYKIGDNKKANTIKMYKLNEKTTSQFLQSARLILKKFVENNIPIIEVDPLSNSYIVSVNGNYIYSRGILTPLNTLSASHLANDKLTSKKILQFFRIPTPDYLCFRKKENTDIKEIRLKLEEFLQKHSRIIAKPQNGLKSKDVFLNIQNVNQALEAYNHIINKEYKGVLFESFAEGDVHRLLLVDGTLIAALRREKGYIIADGISTLNQLITQKNQYLDHGGRNVGRIRIDEKLNAVLKDQGFDSLEDVPAKDTKVFTEIDFSNLETVTEVTDIVSPALTQKLSGLANKIGLGLTGIDVISTDISDEGKCSIIEINKEPSIDFHHYPDYGEAKDVAGEIVRAIIRKYS